MRNARASKSRRPPQRRRVVAARRRRFPRPSLRQRWPVTPAFVVVVAPRSWPLRWTPRTRRSRRSPSLTRTRPIPASSSMSASRPPSEVPRLRQRRRRSSGPRRHPGPFRRRSQSRASRPRRHPAFRTRPATIGPVVRHGCAGSAASASDHSWRAAAAAGGQQRVLYAAAPHCVGRAGRYRRAHAP